MEDLPSDCRLLKELLEVSSHVQSLNSIAEVTTYMSISSIMDVKEHKPSTTSSAGILDGAHNNQIDRGRFSNVGGNSTVTSFSTTFVIIKHESGQRYRRS